MMVVGIDTAGRTTSVALVENGLLICERTCPDRDSISKEEKRSNKNNHAETILPLIQELLQCSGVSLGEITGFALSNGPGSFTGLRIGLSTVKGLAYGSNVCMVGISTLLAHAARVTNYDGLICALLDARKNEVYGGVFRKSGPAIDRVVEDTVGSVANIVGYAQDLRRNEPCLIVGDGAAVYKNFLQDWPGIVLHDATNDLSIAATVACLAEERFRFNDVDDLGTVTPVYVRPFKAGI